MFARVCCSKGNMDIEAARDVRIILACCVGVQAQAVGVNSRQPR